MPAPQAYRPSFTNAVTIDAGIWSASGRPTVAVTVDLDPRLLMDWVSIAAANASNVATIGLGNPPLVVTLTP